MNVTTIPYLYPPPSYQMPIDDYASPSGTSISSTGNNQSFASVLSSAINPSTFTCPSCGAVNPLYPATGSAKGSLGMLDIEWPRGEDVSAWPETIHLDVTSMSNGKIRWEEIGNRESWPGEGEKNCNANAWIIREVAPGQYEARTWEWVGSNQTVKNLENIYADWCPRPGEKVGIMLAGMTRNGHEQNVQQRSNIDWVTWPG